MSEALWLQGDKFALDMEDDDDDEVDPDYFNDLDEDIV